jgi:hypothetical protein
MPEVLLFWRCLRSLLILCGSIQKIEMRRIL